jgi:hypothetical protein
VKGLQFWLVESAQYPINRPTNFSNELTFTVLLACVCVWPGSQHPDARAYVHLDARWLTVQPIVEAPQLTFACIAAFHEPPEESGVSYLIACSTSSATLTEIVDPLVDVLRPWQVSAWVPPLAWLRMPVGKMEVGLECPTGMILQFDEGLDFRRIGVDPRVLGLEFRGPHTDSDVVAIDPHTDPVNGDHLVVWELDTDCGQVRLPDRAKYSSARIGLCRDSGGLLQNRFQAKQATHRFVAAALRNGERTP